jgi:Ca2+-binding EF-hand superfamily protein
LGLIYEDLASRAPDHKMNEKIFEVFFHMNPTFSTPLFLKFCNGTEITKEIFSQSILKYFKDGVEKRLRFLFCLYDIDESHGICFKELLFIVNFVY